MKFKTFLLLTTTLCSTLSLSAQITERERPAEWKNLVPGAQFIDRFQPMLKGTLSADTWGVSGVVPRYIDNGIEDSKWSYWGGNIVRDPEGLYRMFVCGWLENSPRGHAEWGNSLVFDAVSKNLNGPYTPREIIAKGHNPEIYRLKDGRYVLYVIDGRYVSDSLEGPWVYGKFDFDPRDREIIEGLSNLTFARREDGSYLMVCRGGGVWISEDGLSPYQQLTDKRVYPDVEGRFEDPVIWRDHIQYHLIVNDWLGRIAFYQRSKDGINWVTDPGEAYTPGIARHSDGKEEDWFKYERMKVFQDAYGRAIQANFAVIDTLKPLDRPNDNHSSKNICIPLDPGVLLTILNEKAITPQTSSIRLRIAAEEGFNPQTDIDVSSLRFGSSEEVNYGRGCQVANTKNDGNDLIVTFKGKAHGITEAEFAPKLIGKYADGKTLYGYARLPQVEYIEPILSAKAPVFTEEENWSGKIEVKNFGQTASAGSSLKIEYFDHGKPVELVSLPVPSLQPYEQVELEFSGNTPFEREKELMVTIFSRKKIISTFRVTK